MPARMPRDQNTTTFRTLGRGVPRTKAMLIREREVNVKTPTGDMRSTLFVPKITTDDQNITFPGVILYSEIYQVTGPVERLGRRLAGEGYVVLAPDVYHEYETGSMGYSDEAGERGNSLKTEKPLASYDSDAVAAAAWLKDAPECNGRLGTFGVCLGGGLALRAALAVPEVRAAACFFATDIHNRGLGAPDPSVPHSIDSLDKLNGEALMVWGNQDTHIPYDDLTTIRNAFRAANANFQWLEFNAAHAFMRDNGGKGRYDPAISHLAWEAAFELFQRRLTFGLVDDGLTRIRAD